jgi:hypothetical protein
VVKIFLATLFVVAGTCGFCESAGLKKMKSLTCARVLAQRNIVETVYGIKLRFIEEVIDLKDGNFLGTTETKTGKRSIKGITFEEKYDPKNDIAQVTAVLKLVNIKDIIDTSRFNLDKNPEKEIKRVAFASSTPAVARKIAALRAAELDAYKNLYKRIGGFTLESQSKVENFVLTSDKVKASVVGALLGAEVVGFAWEGKGEDAIAVIKVKLNLKELSDMLGQKIIDYKKPFIYAEGRAAQKNENIQQTASKKRAGSSGKSLRINSKVMEGNVDLMP